MYLLNLTIKAASAIFAGLSHRKHVAQKKYQGLSVVVRPDYASQRAADLTQVLSTAVNVQQSVVQLDIWKKSTKVLTRRTL